MTQFPARVLAVLALCCGFAGDVLAHSDVMLDAMTAPHGGQTRMAGAYHLELVAKPSRISVYITDHSGNMVDSDNFTGFAVVTTIVHRQRVTLTPSGGNRLEGRGRFRLAPSTSVNVTLTQGTDTALVAQFMPMRRNAIAPEPQQEEEQPKGAATDKGGEKATERGLDRGPDKGRPKARLP